MVQLIARAFLAATFAAIVFLGMVLLTVPEAWEYVLRRLPAASTLEGAKDFLAQEDVLTVETTQETVQDGTSSQGNGETEYVVPRYVTRKYLKLTSKVDKLTISSIEINRGNCDSLSLQSQMEPRSLKFGESTYVSILCDPIEAKIETDRGVYTFTW